MSERPKLAALVSALDSLKWSEVMRMAIHLSECVTVALMADIQESHPNEPKLWIMYAMDEWLQKDAEASWIKVICALRKTKMNTLATEIEKKSCATTTPHPLESTPTSQCGPRNVPSLDHVGQAACNPVGSKSELSSSEIKEITEETARLRTMFTSLLIHTKICFMEKEEESKKFLRTFQVTLTSLPLFKQHEDKNFLKEEKIRIKKAKDVDEIFDILEPYWNYVDYDLLEHIIKELGTSNLQEEMKEYITELEQFEKKTTVHDFSLATQGKVVIPAHYRELAVKLDKDSKECTLHDVRQFKNSVVNQSSLENYALLLERVSCSSVKIIFALPPEAHANLSETFKDEQFWRKHEILLQVFSESVSVRYGHQFIETHPRPTPWLVRKQPMLTPSKEHCSDYSDKCYVAYKRFVTSFANELTSIEGEQIAYIRSESTDYNADSPNAVLHLLIKLERLGSFSFENPKGLIKIAQDVRREDLVKKVEEFIKAQIPQSLKHATPSKDKPIPKQRKPIPKQRKPIPKQRKPIPEQHKPIPEQHKPIPEQHKPIPKQRKPKLPPTYEQAVEKESTFHESGIPLNVESHANAQPHKLSSKLIIHVFPVIGNETLVVCKLLCIHTGLSSTHHTKAKKLPKQRRPQPLPRYKQPRMQAQDYDHRRKHTL